MPDKKQKNTNRDLAVHGLIREYVKRGLGDNESFISSVMRSVNALRLQTDYVTFIKENWRFLCDRRFLRFCACITLLILFLGGGHSAYFLSSHADSTEIILFSHSQLEPGDKLSGRVVVYDAITKKPVENAQVQFKLKNQSGKEVNLPGIVTTGKDGIANFQQPIQGVAQGEYQLIAITGKKKDVESEAKINIMRTYKCMLSTDKPIYKPGQTIHLRTLTIESSKRKPAAGRDIAIEIKDPKGNKVFIKTLKTSDYGIAAVDFTLAQMVNMGYYTISSRIGNTTTEKIVEVKEYVLPKFNFNLKTNQNFYMPGETIKGSINAEYIFGKPVDNAQVTVFAYDMVDQLVDDDEETGVGFSGMFAKNTKTKTIKKLVEKINVKGKTDKKGNFEFQLQSKDFYAGNSFNQGDAVIVLKVHLKTPGGSFLEKTKKLFMTIKPIKIQIYPENGKIIKGVKNRFYILTKYPDGTPAKTVIGFREQQVNTSDLGVAILEIIPNKTEDLLFTAHDKKGFKGQEIYEVWGLYDISFLVRTDRSVYDVGDTANIEIISAAETGKVFLDVIKDGRCVLMKTIEVEDHKGHLSIDLDADLSGTLLINAYKIVANGGINLDSRKIQVNSVNQLQIVPTLNKKVYKPGETAKIDFKVTDSETGKPAPSALSLAVVDEAVFAISGILPGLEKTYFDIQEEVLEPSAEYHFFDSQGYAGLLKSKSKNESINQAQTLFLSQSPATYSMSRNDGLGYYAREKLLEKSKREYQKDLTNMIMGLLLAFTIIFGFPVFLFTLIRLFRSDDSTEKIIIREKIAGKILLISRVWLWIIPGMVFVIMFVLCCRNLSLINKTVSVSGLSMIAILLFVISFRRMIGNFNELYNIPTSHQKLFKELSFLPPAMIFFHLSIVAFLICGLMFPHTSLVWWISTMFVILIVIVTTLNQLAYSLMPTAQYYNKGFFRTFFAGIIGMLPGYNAAIALIPVFMYFIIFVIVMSMFLPFVSIIKKLGGGGGGSYSKPYAISVVGDAKEKKRPRIRRHFPETLYWKPELITDDKGNASINIPMADSITTWKMSTSAISKNGKFGNNQNGILVFQDFFVDIDLPLQLTQGDEISVPVAVYNYLKSNQTVTLEIEKKSWFKLLDNAQKIIDIDPGSVAGSYFKIKVLKSGNQPFSVIATGKNITDGIERRVKIVPNGQRLLKAVNGILDRDATSNIVFPDHSIENTDKLWLKLYPGPITQVVEGLQSILRMPYGCFEQTTSITYPNVLALQYLKRTGKSLPEVELKALSYIDTGYQRLLTFEVDKSGGFSLYGKSPAKVSLTAYGLMEFSDMAKVYNVDPALINRTREFLKNNFTKVNDTKLLAYLIWALAEAGERKETLTPYLLDIFQKDFQSNSPYTLALCANALVACGEKKRAVAILNQLYQTVSEDDSQAYWKLQKNENGLFHSGGVSLKVETTALIAYAMIKADYNKLLIKKTLNYLMAQKDPNGTWYSTHATVCALRALIAATDLTSADFAKDINLKLAINNKKLEDINITADNYDVYRIIDLTKYLSKGRNVISIMPSDKENNIAYQLVSEYYLPWENNVKKKEQAPPLEINVKYSSKRLKVDEIISCKVNVKFNLKGVAELLIVDLGIPPGFEVDDRAFKTMTECGIIDRYTITPAQIILYIGKLMHGRPLSFDYNLKAKFPLRAQTPPSKVYKYYKPETNDELEPELIDVK